MSKLMNSIHLDRNRFNRRDHHIQEDSLDVRLKKIENEDLEQPQRRQAVFDKIGDYVDLMLTSVQMIYHLNAQMCCLAMKTLFMPFFLIALLYLLSVLTNSFSLYRQTSTPIETLRYLEDIFVISVIVTIFALTLRTLVNSFSPFIHFAKAISAMEFMFYHKSSFVTEDEKFEKEQSIAASDSPETNHRRDQQISAVAAKNSHLMVMKLVSTLLGLKFAMSSLLCLIVLVMYKYLRMYIGDTDAEKFCNTDASRDSGFGEAILAEGSCSWYYLIATYKMSAIIIICLLLTILSTNAALIQWKFIALYIFFYIMMFRIYNIVKDDMELMNAENSIYDNLKIGALTFNPDIGFLVNLHPRTQTSPIYTMFKIIWQSIFFGILHNLGVISFLVRSSAAFSDNFLGLTQLESFTCFLAYLFPLETNLIIMGPYMSVMTNQERITIFSMLFMGNYSVTASLQEIPGIAFYGDDNLQVMKRRDLMCIFGTLIVCRIAYPSDGIERPINPVKAHKSAEAAHVMSTWETIIQGLHMGFWLAATWLISQILIYGSVHVLNWGADVYYTVFAHSVIGLKDILEEVLKLILYPLADTSCLTVTVHEVIHYILDRNDQTKDFAGRLVHRMHVDHWLKVNPRFDLYNNSVLTLLDVFLYKNGTTYIHEEPVLSSHANNSKILPNCIFMSSLLLKVTQMPFLGMYFKTNPNREQSVPKKMVQKLLFSCIASFYLNVMLATVHVGIEE